MMPLSDNIIELINKSDIFSSVNSQVLSDILSENNTKIETYQSGDVIYSSDKYEDAIGILLQGHAKVIKKDNNLFVGSLSICDIFGAQSLFLSSSYFTNKIVANAPTTVIYINKAAITALMNSQHNFSLEYIRYLSKRIYFLNGRITSFTGGTAESRLAKYLLNKAGDYKTLILDVPLNKLAVLLDIGRASLYRAFDSLISSGAIERNGKEIRLLDKNLLYSFIQQK